MKQTPAFLPKPSAGLIAFGLLICAVISAVLCAPVFNIPVFAWVTPVCLLWFTRMAGVKRKFLWLFFTLVCMHVASTYTVDPFPLPVLAIFGIIQGIEELLIFMADRWVFKKTNRFIATLFFPAAYVSREFLNTLLIGSTGWSVANTQYPFPWLTQILSITGIWGVSFIIYWFASVTVWAATSQKQGLPYKKGILIYGLSLTAVLIFGFARYTFSTGENRQPVRVAGLSVPFIHLLETIYTDYSGKTIVLNPRASVISPAMQQINQAEAALITNPDTVIFKNSLLGIKQINDSLFTLSRQAAGQGAKIICWSEGNAIAFKADEPALIGKGKYFAAENKVYLLMAILVINPGKPIPGKKMEENKSVFIGPDGRVLNVFHKNNPVPGVENIEPGDGNIPVIETAYGRAASSICYDADFPIQMRQVGRKKADILMLPSGDWCAISPYHSFMAVYRGIENGSSVLREVSGGLSVATDYRGKIYGALDFYQEGTKLMVTNLPTGHVFTVYSIIGDAFAYACLIGVVMGLVVAGWKR